MNLGNKAVQFFKNFSYTISSNFISLVISTLVVVIVPKLIGIEDYGYWQLYLFYASYVGFLHFGWSDGIYLRYGGEDYDSLDKKIFSSQFYLMVFFQLFIALAITIFSFIIISDGNKLFILVMVAINIIIVNVLSILLLTLQATNRIKDYANINIISRVSYITLIIMFLLFGIREYKMMIIADLIGKLLSLIYAVYACSEIAFHKFHSFDNSMRETVENIRVGIKLMFANIASMLIIGVVRFGIEYSWDIKTFGKISLTLSISNILMLFINAIAIVIFPVLRKLNKKSLPELYSIIRDILMVILFIILLFYFPINVIFLNWLPKYADSLVYMALLFPIGVYEGKMGLLINTYLKTLRKEKYIMRVNIIILFLSMITTLFTTLIFNNLYAAILSILVLITIRCVVAEIYISKLFGISLIKDILYEIIMTIVFVYIGFKTQPNLGFILYSIALIIYLLLKRQDITTSFYKIRKYMNA